MMMQCNQASGIVRTVVTATGSFLILLPLFFLLNIGASAADGVSVVAPSAEIAAPAGQEAATPDAASADCLTAGNVPPSECMALVELYSKTTGVDWLTKTHWLQFGTNAPCGWYGVRCDNGHVTGLRLAGNHLSGTLPLSLGNLPQLSRLRLENNALLGRIPPTICGLTNLTDLSLAYNALFTLRTAVENCLEPLEADWWQSQTAPVTELRITEILTDAIRLSWPPISYTADGGYYEIGFATNIDGPFQMHGTTPDKSASTYLVTGLEPGRTYFIRVRAYTPPHNDQPSEVRGIAAQVVGVTKALSGRVLVAAYFAADNNLASEIPYVLERFRRGTAYNPNIQAVMLVDGRGDGDTTLLEIANGTLFTTTVVQDHWGVTELDSADPEVLAWFLQYARTEFPSEREVAAIIGHGVALAPEVEWPEQAAGQRHGSGNLPASDQIPPLPKEHEYTPSDVTNRGYMSAIDVGRALMAATNNGADPFDVLFFDQCFQGSLDTLYEVRNSATVYVASPNYAWLVAAYDRYLTRFTPTAMPFQMARSIIENYQSSLDQRHPNSIFWITNSDLISIATQINLLADALRAALAANEQPKIVSAVQQAKYVDTTQCGRVNLELGPPDELIGIESFGAALQANFVGDPYGVSTALAGLQPLMENVAKRFISGRPYIAPNEVWDYGNTLTILAPLPRTSASNVAWRASIYNDNMPYTATWTVDPTQPVTVTESLAFVREGRWDEFLAEWYTNLTPTVGQWCQYIPPAQVAVSETAQLSLTVSAVTTDSVQLAWTATDDHSAVEYRLYAQDPYAIGLEAQQSIPLNASGITFSGLDRGEYRYQLVARNDEQMMIAQSNEVTVTISGGGPDFDLVSLLLPFVASD